MTPALPFPSGPSGADAGDSFLAGIRSAWIQGARFTLPFSSGTTEKSS